MSSNIPFEFDRINSDRVGSNRLFHFSLPSKFTASHHVVAQRTARYDHTFILTKIVAVSWRMIFTKNTSFIEEMDNDIVNYLVFRPLCYIGETSYLSAYAKFSYQNSTTSDHLFRLLSSNYLFFFKSLFPCFFSLTSFLHAQLTVTSIPIKSNSKARPCLDSHAVCYTIKQEVNFVHLSIAKRKKRYLGILHGI